MKKKFTILIAALALLVFMTPSLAGWGQTRDNYNVTYNYSDLGSMLSGNYTDASSYWKVPGTADNTATIAIPITLQPTSNITITFNIATFGGGDTPTSSNTTITAVGTEAGSNWSGSGVSTYPTTSSYVNGVMTITKPASPTTLEGLTITMGVDEDVRIFRLKSITVSYEYSSAAVATPTFSPVEGTYTSAQNVTISCTTAGATIRYTTDGTDPTSTSTLYENPIPVSSTTTIKARAFNGSDESYVGSATYTILHAGTAADPFTVSDARIALNTTDLIDPEEDYYVTGIIAKKNSISSGNLTYWLSDDGSMTNNLQCYSGKYINGADFTDVNDLEVGDIATVKGKLLIYGGSTYQFNANNEVVSITTRTKVNIATFTAATNPLILGETPTTNTSVTNNQPGWTPVSYTYESDDTDVATVNASGVVTAVAKGTANITVTPVVSPTDPTYKVGESKSLEITVSNPSHTAYFSVNGAINSVVVEEGEDITFPADPAAIGSKSFVGWVSTAIDGTTDETPTFVPSATMSTSDVTYYAVFATSTSGAVIKTDTLTRATTGVTGTSYSAWTGKQATNNSHSDAFYAGCTAGGNSSIQLNASTKDSKRGIISTTSGGKLKKVTITWESHTGTGRSVTVYGKNKAYTTMEAFNSDNGKGTVLGTITKGTSTELTINCDSTYVGFYATDAIYMSKISIDWETTGTVYSGYCTTIVLATKEIEGYTDNASGWYLIASPSLLMTPTAENGFLTNTYDLYRFDQTGGENNKPWRNYKQNDFDLISGTGYLYANDKGTELTFTGQPYNGNGEVGLTYVESLEDELLKGLNLVGNPFNSTATINKPFYRMNNQHNGFTAEVAAYSPVNPMEGVFVYATAVDQTVTFTPAAQNSNAPSNNVAMVAMNLVQNRSNVIDRAIVCFDSEDVLPKFQLFENSTKLYIKKDGKDYAIVGSKDQGEMPVNFVAAEDGQYTITVNTENIEMGYLHLIDNIAGKDIDLLATPSYTFNAKGDDYESRFRLVFSTTMVNAEMGEEFAFISDGQLVIANVGEAILQVIDVTGRVVAIENINGTCSKAINAKAGVYVLRLINGTDVKTQKIVIR